MTRHIILCGIQHLNLLEEDGQVVWLEFLNGILTLQIHLLLSTGLLIYEYII